MLHLKRLTSQVGISLVELLVAGLVMGTAVVGLTLMYGTGSNWVAATGQSRVATALAQQMIGQVRSQGWACATTPPAPPSCQIGLPQAGVRTPPETVYPAGVSDPGVSSFTRNTCIQYVSDVQMNEPP